MQTDRATLGVISSRYRDLQGLKQAVMGLVLLVFFAWMLVFPLSMKEIRTPADYTRISAGVLFLLVVFGAGIIAARSVSSWYDRTYGRVSPSPRQKRLSLVLMIAGVVAFLVPFEVEILANNAGTALPFNFVLLGVSAWVMAYWLYLGRKFHHYLAIAGVGLALTLLSVGGVPTNGFASQIREVFLFMGLASIVGGVVDHRILTRALDGAGAVGVDS